MAEKERFLKAKEIFLQAVERDETFREAFVAWACVGDEALRQEVLRLLKGDARANVDWQETVRLQVEEQLKHLPSNAVASEYPVGELFGGRYLIQSKLGEGGIGAVYLATDERVYSRPVVVKLLLNKSSGNQYLVDKFRHEGESLARIKHPGVVAVIDLGDLSDGKPYLVMEYVEGKTLAAEIQAGGMDFQRAALFIRQIAQALSAAHFAGVVHRDLKPANVMIQQLSDNAEQAKLIDFGIAKVANPLSADATQVPMPVGTPAYIAPEQLEHSQASPASDIYTLGVMAYEMLTGERPFKVKSPVHASDYSWLFELIKKQQAGVQVKPRALRADLPDAAQAEILRALSYNPKDRHERAYEFGEKLAHALSAANVSQTPHAQPEPQAFQMRLDEIVADKPEETSQAVLSFEKLWSAATYTDRIHPVTFESIEQERSLQVYRGLGGPQQKTRYVFPLGSKVCLALNMKRGGYLTLLDQGPEGIVYCLCPSWFAPDARLGAGQFYLPQHGTRYEAFELSGKPGREKLLAIISDEALGLNWLTADASIPARTMQPADFDELITRLRQLGDGRWTALATYFEVSD